MEYRRTVLRGAIVCLLSAGAACSGGTTDGDVVSTDAAADSAGGDSGTTVANPFFPQNLQDAIGALETAIGTQGSPSDVRLGLIVNGCSNFWNQAQIGTARSADRI